MNEKWRYEDFQMREIGRVIRNFSWLENTIKEGLCRYLKLGVLDCFTLTAHLGFRQTLDLLESFYKTDRKLRQRKGVVLGRLLRKAEVAERDRNEIVHSLWLPERFKKNDIKLSQVRVTSRRGLDINTVHGRTLAQVETIREIADGFYRLNKQLRKALHLRLDDIVEF